MENNFGKNLTGTSLFLQTSVIFQWIFALLGFNLPPISSCGCQQLQVRLVWFGFGIYSLVLFFAVIWQVYINNVVLSVVVKNYNLDSLSSALSISHNITVAFVQAVMQLSVFTKQKRFGLLMRSIAQLERDLLLYYAEYEWLQNDINLNLNFHQRCLRFRHYMAWRYGLFIVIFIILMNLVNYQLTAEMLNFRDKLLTIFLITALQVKVLEFCLYAQIVYEFLASVHSFLKCLKYEIAKSNGKGLMSLAVHRKLMANQFLLNRIWLLVRSIEAYFAVPMLVLFLYNGISITLVINWSYVGLLYLYKWDGFGLFSLLYVFFILFVMFIPCWLSQLCIDKYKQFGSMLHNIRVNDDFILNHQIREYSLQLRHQEMLFTCAGFFDFNLKYFGLMVLSISTYVAILIQFKLQKETEKLNVRL